MRFPSSQAITSLANRARRTARLHQMEGLPAFERLFRQHSSITSTRREALRTEQTDSRRSRDQSAANRRGRFQRRATATLTLLILALRNGWTRATRRGTADGRETGSLTRRQPTNA